MPQVREKFPHLDRIELVTVLPLRRTIYTALESFEPVFEAHPDMKVIALPEGAMGAGSSKELTTYNRSSFVSSLIPKIRTMLSKKWWRETSVGQPSCGIYTND